MEARSLSDVLALAADPPANLQVEASQNVQEPLVLYIVRVPGSKGALINSNGCCTGVASD